MNKWAVWGVIMVLALAVFISAWNYVPPEDVRYSPIGSSGDYSSVSVPVLISKIDAKRSEIGNPNGFSEIIEARMLEGLKIAVIQQSTESIDYNRFSFGSCVNQVNKVCNVYCEAQDNYSYNACMNGYRLWPIMDEEGCLTKGENFVKEAYS